MTDVDLEFYEIPGLDNQYICATEIKTHESKWSLPLGKDSRTYFFSELNSYFENEKVDSVHLYSSQDATLSEKKFFNSLDTLSNLYAENARIHERTGKLVTAFGALCVHPFILAVGAAVWYGGYNERKTGKTVDQFKEYAQDLNVTTHKKLEELKAEYDSFNFDELYDRRKEIYDEITFYEQVFGLTKKHKTELAQIRNELHDNMMSLNKKAEEIAFEEEDTVFLDIATAYHNKAHGGGGDFFVSTHNVDPPWEETPE